jgi:hypothetical protein
VAGRRRRRQRPARVRLPGYNLLTWSKGGIAYSAISDLNMGELGNCRLCSERAAALL